MKKKKAVCIIKKCTDKYIKYKSKNKNLYFFYTKMIKFKSIFKAIIIYLREKNHFFLTLFMNTSIKGVRFC
jgi:hypothetical protein